METPKEKRFVWIWFPLTAILFFALASYLYFLPELRFQQAEEAFQNGDYEKALRLIEKEQSERTALLADRIQIEQARLSLERGDREKSLAYLETLPETKDVLELKQQIAYEDAIESFQAGRWTEAIERFTALKGYQDAYRYIDRASAAAAEEMYQQGYGAEAVEALLNLGDETYTARAYEIAEEVTGVQDPEEALRMIRGLDADEIEKLKIRKQKQEDAQRTILAAGFFHTVGLNADGTVVSCGDNSFHQCAVEEWSDVVEIAAGAYHTVARKTDGTVIATGDNRYGQCDVGEWADVIRIVANNYDTIALTKSGRILHTGYHAYSVMETWPSDIVSISAGSYAVAAIRKNGQLITTHISSDAPDFTGLVFCSVQTGYSVGLTEEGTPVAHGITLPDDWKELVAVSAGTNRILGLMADGTVLEYAFMERDTILPEPQTGINAIANAATHVALLKEDGSVICYGENRFGECNTSDWNLR